MSYKPRTSRNSLPDQDKLTADTLESFFGAGCWKWAVDDIPSTANRLQVRNQNTVAKPQDVDRYALAYTREDPVPAIVVTNDGSKGGPRLLVDGSTRTEGCLRAMSAAKRALIIPQFVLNVDPDNLDEVTMGQLLMLGVSLNAKNGTPMTLRNISEVLSVAVPDEASISSNALAAMLHVSPSTIQRVRTLRAAESRAERLDVEGVSALSLSHLVLLGQKEPKISDQIFKGITTLVMRARLSTNEMKVLFKDVEASLNDKDRMGVIARWERECADRIAGRAARPTAVRRLQLLLGQLERIDPKAMVENNAALFDANLARMYTARDKLDEMIKAQTATMRARGPIPAPTFSDSKR
jgi:hypothetical protein